MSNNHIALSVASPCRDLRILIDATANADISRIHANWSQLHEWLVRHGVDASAGVTRLALSENAHLGGLDVSTLTIECDEELDARTDDAYMRMRVAHNFGLGCVTVFAGPRNAAAYDYLVAALLRLTTLADRLGLDVLLGNRGGSCIEQIDDVSRIFADVGAHNLYLDLNIVEFHAASVNPCDACLAFGSRVAGVRLSNVAGGIRASLEKGEIDIGAVLRATERSECHCPFVVTAADERDVAAQLRADVRFLESAGYVME